MINWLQDRKVQELSVWSETDFDKVHSTLYEY